ncbi:MULTISPECIES: molybdopterin-dependent oxidoreductase [unclassified Bacillus (in: firmicutes)]|uniref:molybdopterin-dependent oxidoreductase n=1 Tax=unclassified Bacillus (in: firmicutes) TaxID=185979 RepID=UPI0008E527E2|nr:MULTISPECIES: molybdopterin-dependent oxidoreductase [unclassified Bacillus (in: firmicutes)]SFB01793.1 Anaerobic selenocysteine-containing dehydrogenase [Bacillus sp. UNCCL13]SFQ89248.1 Anaerobic selenocysteine-containing dehydrogenase [Bacillus sp. cl95]
MAKVYQSACPLNCWDSCGFHVTVEDGKVQKVEGDPDHPITKGKICGRGRMLETRTNSLQRLLYPMKKVNGQFIQVSWKQALDEIAAIMADIKEQYGSTAILHSHDYANNGILKNIDKRFFNAYGGVTELIGSLCWGAGIEAQKWDFGDSYSHHPDDVLNSKNIVIWGRNVARTNMHFYQKLQEAKKNGSKIFVIDPIYNATAKLADEYISIKPGMDGILAIGIMKVLLESGLQDSHFIENFTQGFEDLITLLNDVSFEDVCQMTEIPLETVRKLAEIYAEKPVSTHLGLGMQRYENGGNTIRLLDALVAISGNIGIAGGGSNYGNLQVGQSFAFDELTLTTRKENSRTFTMMKQAEGILNSVNPKIQMVFVTCGNPLVQVPDSNKIRKAFEDVPHLVVVDQFMTDTAEMADYVLPTTTAFEEEDFYYASMYHHYVNYGPKLVEAPGEAKSDLWIWSELAKRLGFEEDFEFSRDEYMKMSLKPLEKHGIHLEQLRKDGHIELPVEKIPWSGHHFRTPSGKYEFTAQLGFVKGQNGKLTAATPSESKWTNPSLAERYPYTFLTIHPLRSNHSQHYHILKPEPKVKIEVAENIASKLGLQEGDMARVWNERGEIKGTISLLKKAHPNTINVDEGIWSRFGGSVNLLTPDGESDNGLGSVLYDCLVNIEKI